MKENKDLLKKLNGLGFPLLEPEETQNVNDVLAEVVKSNDMRLWEGFPVMLANTAEKGLFNYSKVSEFLKKSTHKSSLDLLMLMSLALYKVLGLTLNWADKFYKNLATDRKKEFNALLNKLKKDEDFKLDNNDMSSRRLKVTFNNYFTKSKTKLNDLLLMKEELGLEYALSQIFSSKQKELFLKKLKGDKLTKTEKEYFSRVVKKKVLALANPELHRLARELL